MVVTLLPITDHFVGSSLCNAILCRLHIIVTQLNHLRPHSLNTIRHTASCRARKAPNARLLQEARRWLTEPTPSKHLLRSRQCLFRVYLQNYIRIVDTFANLTLWCFNHSSLKKCDRALHCPSAGFLRIGGPEQAVTPIVGIIEATALSSATVTEWTRFIRQLLADNVDERKLAKRKYHRGHLVEGVWVVAGIERTKEKKMFCSGSGEHGRQNHQRYSLPTHFA
ncbi:hypothetical protein RF11_08438 [Thelohanellus kitauei]|uniref:Uncharacterized protein n=1 Tax=Thelohanellus kitauei TaxID=669202 RepID=A0A0C2MCT4_THEKT|nr:hypothetical protein RF11_08438 [Thelohanellus kitauei]